MDYTISEIYKRARTYYQRTSCTAHRLTIYIYTMLDQSAAVDLDQWHQSLALAKLITSWVTEDSTKSDQHDETRQDKTDQRDQDTSNRNP